jgi:outer membrane protein insertion porin family
MFRKIMILTMVFLMFSAMTLLGVSAAAEGKTALLPFTIYSQENLGYLQKNILETLSNNLAKQKIPLIPLAQSQNWIGKNIPGDWGELRAIGKEMGADWIVFGSLTKLGQRISLNGNLLETRTEASPLTFALTEEGLENIPRLLERFSRELALRILGQEKIASISIRGNQRIEIPVIEKEIKSKVGEAYNPELLDQDLRNIFKMGFFADVRLEVNQTPEGKGVVFVVVERPFIKRIEFKGNKEIKDDDLKDQLTVKPYTILNLNTVTESQEKLNVYYQSKGFYNVQITYSISYEDKGQAGIVVFNITEGKKVYIKTITFEGNKSFPAKKLKEIMETNEKGFFYWLTSSGVYKKELLEQDLEKLSSYYYNHGFLKAKIGEPAVRHEAEWIYITIPVEEGQQFKMGSVDIKGDMIQPKEKMMALLSISKEKFYNREVIRKDILKLTDIYSAEGFAFAEITPQIQEESSTPKVDLTYDIKKGSKVYFERIDIVGNTKTRDKVIRREFKVSEKGLFDSTALRKSNENLHRLDFFEEINISTSPGSQEDRMNLKVEVKEKMTGSFSVGAGYSTTENLIFMGQIAQRNLFGRGQQLSLNAAIGSISKRYILNFTDPYLFDTRWHGGISLYNWEYIYDQYTKDSFGGTAEMGHPFWGDENKAYLAYTYDNANVTQVHDDAALVIKDMSGWHQKSSLRLTLKRDTRDLVFNTTKGSIHSASVEYAGGPLGGTSAFTKYIVSSGHYFPLFWDTTFFINGKYGLITQNAGGDLPLFEKFYLGGINSIRGFKNLTISPVDPATGDKVGGDQMLQFNFEYIFPLVQKAGIKGVVFFDAGNAWSNDSSVLNLNGTGFGSLRTSVGFGIRWYSPMGPLRLEWGWNLAPKQGEDSNAWDFSIGTFF